jgi:hypothetical protein
VIAHLYIAQSLCGSLEKEVDKGGGEGVHYL